MRVLVMCLTILPNSKYVPCREKTIYFRQFVPNTGSKFDGRNTGVVHRDGFSSLSGIPTAVFVGKEDSYSNTTQCFCPPKDPCPANGARDLSQCEGVPFLMSWPHFYLADPVYRDSIVGMNPDPELHQLRFEISDVTGATVKGRFKAQISLQMQPISSMSLFKGVQKVVMPLFWTSQDADLTQSKLDEMYWVVKGVRCGRWVSLGIGGFGLVFVAVGTILSFSGYLR